MRSQYLEREQPSQTDTKSHFTKWKYRTFGDYFFAHLGLCAVVILSVVRVTLWLIHLVWCISSDLVHIVLLLSPGRLSWRVITIYDMTSSVCLNTFLLFNHADVSWQVVTSAMAWSRSVRAVFVHWLFDTIELHSRLCTDCDLFNAIHHCIIISIVQR